ncbi:MAG: hypothetical protein LQ350_005363 [Teloschistes chrysophthalmus]|nr:MAG: hypothetical protein LQ350_005363 [Niorma chrysophthalma]
MLGAMQFGLFGLLLPIIASALYGFGLAFYRLFLGPLSKFPGPKLAALTRKYESYYEAVQNYEYVWKIKKLHQQYGPIIRISPHELHIDDADFFEKLNSFQGKWDKDPYTAHQFANPGSSVGTIDHELHRKRRSAVLPFFSKQKIYALEPVIQSTIDRLCNKMEDYVKSGQPLNLRNAYKCFAADVVAEYCFAESGNLIEKPDFSLAHWREHQQGLKAGLRARYLPSWYMPVVRGAPEWIRATVDPAAKHFEIWHRDVDGSVRRLEDKKNEDFFEKAGHRTIFHELINSEILPPQEKQTIRVIQEAGAMVGAGGESTSQVLTALTFALVANPEKLKKLREELRTVIPHSNSPVPTLKQLEKLPYLTIVSMTPIFLHVDPNIFPDPHSFLPERWLGLNESERQRLEHYLVPYSRGSRQCSGLK